MSRNTTTDKLEQAGAIARATGLLENMQSRLAVGSKGWREKQLADWQSLRQIANQQIAKAELLEKPEQAQEQPQLLPKAV